MEWLLRPLCASAQDKLNRCPLISCNMDLRKSFSILIYCNKLPTAVLKIFSREPFSKNYCTHTML